MDKTLNFWAVKPEYLVPPVFRHLAPDTLTEWTSKGSIGGVDCGIVGLEEGSVHVPLKVAIKLSPTPRTMLRHSRRRWPTITLNSFGEDFCCEIYFFKQLRLDEAPT